VRKFATLIIGAAVACSSVAAALPAGAATSADTKKFCDANFKISLLFNTLPDGEPTAKQLKALAKQLNPQLTAALKVAPSEIKADVETAAKAIKADPSSLFTDDAVGQAGSAIDDWAVANCDYQAIDVTATDYSFSGAPADVAKGKTVVTMTNNGAEPHLALIARKKTDKSAEEILALPEAQARKQIEELGSAYAAPGETGIGYVDLQKSGDYIMLCPIATGSTADTEGTGPPHFVSGMVTEFTVS
jgi:uncharacterized cupredoxin-like copper-binding protein